MLSSNRFFGNAGRSRWMAGLNRQAYGGALQDWTRTEVAAGLPKTAAVPAGYGERALALPREAGAFASYNRMRWSIDAPATMDAAHVYALDLQWGGDMDADLYGLGVVQAVPAWGAQLEIALAALAPFDLTLSYGIDLAAAMDAVAPIEVTMAYGIDLAGDIAALAPIEVTLAYGIDLAADFAGAAVADGFAMSYGMALAAGSGVFGLGVWSASDAPDAGELTPAGIAAATVQALQATTIPVDVAKVNGLLVDGSGTTGDPWGPA